MAIRTPEIPVRAIVGHKATQTVCRILRADPVGYDGWLYYAAEVAAPGKVHRSTAGGLVRLPSPVSPAASPAGEAATAEGAIWFLPPPTQSPPSPQAGSESGAGA